MRVRADTLDRTLPPDTGRLRVEAGSAAALRASLSGPLASLRSRRVTIVVESWQPPRPGWSAQLGPLPGVARFEIRLPDATPGPVLVRVVLTAALPFQLVAAAALRALMPTGRLPVPVSPDVAAYGQLPAWLPPWDNVAGLVADSPDEQAIRPYDIVARDDGLSLEDSPVGPAGGPDGAAPRPRGPASRVVVDATVTNPRGYRADRVLDASADLVAGQLTVRAGAAGFTVSMVDAPADRIAAVRALRSIRIDTVDGHDPAGAAVLLAQLAMSGVVIHTPAPLPEAIAHRLGPRLLPILAEPLSPISAIRSPVTDRPSADQSLADRSATEREARSVRQRRAALREHATAWALPAAACFPDEVRTPSVSAVMVLTEPDRISSALAMLAAQDYPSLEIMLAFPSTMDSVIRSTLDELSSPHGVGVVLVPVPAEHGVDVENAYDEATGRGRGSLVTRFEPGGRYGAEHIWDLVLALHYSGATVVGKACEFFAVDPDNAVRRPAATSEAFTESLSDGPLLLSRSDLLAAGGWRRVAAGPGYQTHPFGFVRPDHEPADSRSATDTCTFPLMVVTS